MLVAQHVKECDEFTVKDVQYGDERPSREGIFLLRSNTK